MHEQMAIIANHHHIFGSKNKLGTHAGHRARDNMMDVTRWNAAAFTKAPAFIKNLCHNAQISRSRGFYLSRDHKTSRE
jgi:hypothetical protein